MPDNWHTPMYDLFFFILFRQFSHEFLPVSRLRLRHRTDITQASIALKDIKLPVMESSCDIYKQIRLYTVAVSFSREWKTLPYYFIFKPFLWFLHQQSCHPGYIFIFLCICFYVSSGDSQGQYFIGGNCPVIMGIANTEVVYETRYKFSAPSSGVC